METRPHLRTSVPLVGSQLSLPLQKEAWLGARTNLSDDDGLTWALGKLHIPHESSDSRKTPEWLEKSFLVSYRAKRGKKKEEQEARLTRGAVTASR